MSNLLDITYNSYSGDYEYVDDEEAPYYHGRVLGIKSLITYEAPTLEELKEEFKQSIEDYIACCRELGVEIETPSIK